VDTRDISLTPGILLTGQWEPHITALWSTLIKPGMTVVDVGSHMGYYSVLAGKLVEGFGKVHAFEANPVIYETLFKNIFINGLIDRVIQNNLAVYSHSTTLEFHTLQRATGGNSLVDFTEEYQERFNEKVSSITIQATSLDEYFQSQGTLKVDVVKIDAEGSEPFIFEGMQKILESNPDIVIICEFNAGLIHGCGNEPKIFLQKLQAHGLILRKIDLDSQVSSTSETELLHLGTADLFLTKHLQAL
jgi:FkbM family methyltransferase